MIRVLLVDDYPSVRRAIAEILDACCPECEIVGEASTGAEAVKLTEELMPDVVLMDVRMPLMDGIEAALRIRMAGLPAEIVTYTGLASPRLSRRAAAAGVFCHLLKPFNVIQLANKVKAAGLTAKGLPSAG